MAQRAGPAGGAGRVGGGGVGGRRVQGGSREGPGGGPELHLEGGGGAEQGGERGEHRGAKAWSRYTLMNAAKKTDNSGRSAKGLGTSWCLSGHHNIFF